MIARPRLGGVGARPSVVIVATQLAITTQPANAVSGVLFTTQPVIEIRDVSGSRVSGSTVAVTVAIASGSGVLSGTTTVNAVAGTATFTNLIITGTDNYTLTFTSSGLTPATSSTFNGTTILFYDDFASGDFSKTMNGMRWDSLPDGSGGSSFYVRVSTNKPLPGKTKCVEFRQGFSGAQKIAELDMTGIPNLPEVYLQYPLYFLDGTEGLGPKLIIPASDLATSGGVGNENKGLRIYGGPGGKSAYGTSPTCKMGLDIRGFHLQPDAKIYGSYCYSPDPVSVTDFRVNGVDVHKIKSDGSNFHFTSTTAYLRITAGPATPGDYRITAVDGTNGEFTIPSFTGSLGASGISGTVFDQYVQGAADSVPGAYTGDFNYLNDSIRGRYHEVRVHAKPATAANNDGVLELWVDRVLVFSKTNIHNYAYGIGPTTFSGLYILGEWDCGFDPAQVSYLGEFYLCTGGFPP